MNTACFLTDLPAELLAHIAGYLDIRSAGRLALACKRFSAKSAARGSVILLQHHPEYPLLFATQRGDVQSQSQAVDRLRSRTDCLALFQHLNFPMLQANSLHPIVSVFRACIWVLLADRNDGFSQLWLPLSKLHRPAIFESNWIERAFFVACCRSHIRSIHMLATLEAAGVFHLFVPSPRLASLFEEVCAQKPGPAFTADTKLQFLNAIARFNWRSSGFVQPFYAAAITHPNNHIGIVIHLALLFFEPEPNDIRHRIRATCLPELLDACDAHGRSDLVATLMQLYLLSDRQHQQDTVSLMILGRFGVSATSSQPAPAKPHIIFPATRIALCASLGTYLAPYGVSPSTAITFRQLLAHCDWHSRFVPWLLAISARGHYQHAALRWFLSHVHINLVAIHLLPMATYTLDGGLQAWPAHDQPEHGDGQRDMTWASARWFKSQVDACLVCKQCNQIRSRAASLLQGARGRDSSSAAYAVAKRLVERPFEWTVEYQGRPDHVVQAEALAVYKLATEAGSSSVGGGVGGAIRAIFQGVGGMFANMAG